MGIGVVAAGYSPFMHAVNTLNTAVVKRHALAVGFDTVGVAALRASDHAAFYRAWLAAGRHGAMEYLARADAVERRLDPAAAWPQLKSAIVVGLNYYTEADGETDAGASVAIIARYARGRDYHKVIRKKLLALLERLETGAGCTLPAARAYVDTGPVLERELARRAGLGWFGRNTMLIDPRRGSYFFLGTLLVELELEPDTPFEADHCGRCNACVEACPTGALLGRDASGAPVMDATRCISYLTIENRGAIPRELRPLIGNRVFGCDICQEVCPFNNPKFVQLTSERDLRSDWREDRDRPSARAALPSADSRALVELMRMSYEDWDAWTRGSAIRRAGYAGLKRNVAVALGNRGAADATPALAQALAEENCLVRSHTAWALGMIGSRDARAALAEQLRHETEPAVINEIEAALAMSRAPGAG